MQRSPRTIKILKGLRWLSALLCWLVAYKLFHIATSTDGGAASAVSLLVMFALIIAGGLLFLPESLPLLTRPFTAIIDSIYGMGPGKGKPPFNCKLARGYVEMERYEDALNEYDRVMGFHPKESEPYRESIRLLVDRFEDREEAAEMLSRGLRKMKSREERKALQEFFDDTVKRLPVVGGEGSG